MERQGLILEESAIQLQLKTILNRVQHFVGFVYREVRLRCRQGKPHSIEILVEPHGGIRRRCSRCQRPAPGYDCLPPRRWLFVPLWGIPTYFYYAPRRVRCPGTVSVSRPWQAPRAGINPRFLLTSPNFRLLLIFNCYFLMVIQKRHFSAGEGGEELLSPLLTTSSSSRAAEPEVNLRMR